MPLTMPRIGELKQIVDIVEVGPPYSIDGSGAIVSVLLSGIRANVVPLGGSIDPNSQQELMSRQAYNIWIRYRAGITAFQQIVWKGSRLIMTAPPENFNNRWILIHGEERICKQV